jgi:hypothetical protein
MPRAALGKLVRPRERRSEVGPTRTSVPAAERLQGLRARLASTEVPSTLRAINVDVSELAAIAPENLLGDIGELTDRVFAKIDSIVPPKAPRKSRKQRPSAAAADEAEPAIFSVKADLLLARLRAVHGEVRGDIPPGLLPP